jgi:hypothetical protein
MSVLKECPWHQFYMILKFLKKKWMLDAYNYFVRWANSGGTDNSDWYGRQSRQQESLN